MIIATAGHVDHGKTKLLHALTGINADRLPEEQQRGLTIDLGYAFMAYHSPKSNQQQRLGFIDVPGHEKFLSNMLAGVGTAHHAMLIVAGDEGMMPQSYEHLTILRLLAMDSLTVVITKSDLTSVAQQQQLEATLSQLLFQYGFTQATIFHCSAHTNDGIDALKQHLIELADNEQQHDNTLNFKLAIDRAFHVKGSGLVVTGTALNGQINVGDSLCLVSHSSLKKGHCQPNIVRVKSIHAQGQATESATANQRVALNISGDIDKASLNRGDWLLHTAPTTMIKRITVKLTANHLIKHWQNIQVFHAATHTTGRIALLEDKQLALGETALAEITLDTPLCLTEQDRLLLRDPAQKINLGSAIVIDLLPPNRGKRNSQRLEYLNQRANLNALSDIIEFKLQHAPQSRQQLLEQHQCHTEVISQLLASNTTIEQYGDYLCYDSYQQALQQHIIATLEQYHQQAQDTLGVGKDRLYRMTALNQPQVIFNAMINQLLNQQLLANTRGWLHLAAHQLQLTQPELQCWHQIEQLMTTDPQPWWIRDLASEIGEDEESLRKLGYKLAQLSYVAAIVKDRYVSHQYLVQMATEIRQHTAQHQKLETAEFRNISQLGRKVAIQLLEYFDKIGFTKRKFNYRELKDQDLLQD
ncbi:selenocysteine-specific translation elongation factor [Photobacterium phosphoreum]|uniref:Selenocysteine-specific translation elongation factor n=1 Tax=Photobacterium phosphoreum TaxID=659 RepID=A0A2T3JX14_PHOPO|nr:selenocysteine-specific translation elongation factor [Photobacterium phosphoreum]PSU27813.1 selenocysteine-specific translation elongation factor [Photobacterium phosphoreum]PSU42456.1 selenocysteine-specific translation elongation factor [Photobacterium phosphoreum]PSU53912.1 selenocysteine-specific translation elongation factor [Photobacterium phosphoreum]